jgi:hypothetical protein
MVLGVPTYDLLFQGINITAAVRAAAASTNCGQPVLSCGGVEVYEGYTVCSASFSGSCFGVSASQSSCDYVKYPSEICYASTGWKLTITASIA